uniref:Etoposide-induced protein 2.4 homolog isoform X1 n=2 Tax=Diabrotica virgifera virgifera TaxID=50390 RepID=A0A6P7FZ24_DIAVI
MDIQKIFYAVFRGVFDSFTGMYALIYLDKEINERKITRQSPTRLNSVRQKPIDPKEGTPLRQLKRHEESKVIKRIMQCGTLNGIIFLSSLLLFEYVFLPSVNQSLGYVYGRESFMGKRIWSWIETIVSIIFKTIWVIPLFLLSKVVNALWFQDIADSAYRHSRGRPVFSQSLSKVLADSIFSVLIQLLFLIQATAVSYIPIYMVGYTLSLAQMCMLYSLYAFEYKWFNMGWELHKRLSFIETHWPYFMGFGLPMAIVTQLSDSWVISGCVFSVLFPFFIISGNEANPILNTSGFPLHFFAPVIAISNTLFSKTIGSSKR